MHRCQHQRTKMRDKMDQKSEKAHQHATKCTLKHHLLFLSPPQCASGTAVFTLYADLARAKITRDVFNPGEVGIHIDAALNFKHVKHTKIIQIDTLHDQC